MGTPLPTCDLHGLTRPRVLFYTQRHLAVSEDSFVCLASGFWMEWRPEILLTVIHPRLSVRQLRSPRLSPSLVLQLPRVFRPDPHGPASRLPETVSRKLCLMSLPFQKAQTSIKLCMGLSPSCRVGILMIPIFRSCPDDGEISNSNYFSPKLILPGAELGVLCI